MEAVYISYMILEILFADRVTRCPQQNQLKNDFIIIEVYLLYDS